MVTIEDIRAVAAALPRSTEAVVRGRIKFRVGRIVYLALSRDAEPDKFSLPSQSDMRYHWVHARLAAIDADELRELVEDAWSLCVPRSVAEEYAATQRAGS